MRNARTRIQGGGKQKAWQVRNRAEQNQEERNITADFGTERGSALVSPL